MTPDGAVPAPPKASSNFAQPLNLLEKSTAMFGMFRGEYNFESDDAKVWLATGVRDGLEHNILANPSSDALGNTSSYRFDNFRKDLITTSEIGVRLGFETGFIQHKVSASGSIFARSETLRVLGLYGFAWRFGTLNTVSAPDATFSWRCVCSSPRLDQSRQDRQCCAGGHDHLRG